MKGCRRLKIVGCEARLHHDCVYQQDAKIFIPVTQLDLVQKYVGAAEKAPKINKLGGTEWQKAKAKVAKKVEDIADELLQLYAERELKQRLRISLKMMM